MTVETNEQQQQLQNNSGFKSLQIDDKFGPWTSSRNFSLWSTEKADEIIF